MESSIHSPDLTRLAELKSQEAARLFRELLWCESSRLGLRNVVVSDNITVADGGIDAKAELPCAENKGVSGSFHFQIKSGKSFKPWQGGAISKELFGQGKPQNKKLLGKAIRNCLDQRGTYVMVAMGHDFQPVEHTEAVGHLRKAFAKCGYAGAKVEVWGASQITLMMRRYPSLCLDFNGRATSQFQTIMSWSKNSDMSERLALGTPQKNFIKQVTDLVRSLEVQHIRIIGEPGVGKTRTILEALKCEEDLAPKTIYVRQADTFINGSLFNELLKDDRDYWAIVVIDECDEDDRASIYRLLKGRNRLKLITIDHGPDVSRDDSMITIDFPPLADAEIGAILIEYIGKSIDLHHWISWCQGSARVAHAVGENLKRNPKDILKAPATVPIWDRFVLGYKKRVGPDADRLLAVMRHIALFRKFGFKKPVDTEGKFVAEFAGKVDLSITQGKFESDVQRLVARRILQGGHTLRIVPKALHVHLWREWWECYGLNADLADILKQMPETLRKWFLDMLAYANNVESAKRAVQDVLKTPGGPFESRDFLLSASGSNFMSSLAEADPIESLALLTRTVGTWPIATLKVESEGRQNLAYALAKIAVWDIHFQAAALLLVRLCHGETSRYSNNSKGMLTEMFNLVSGPTQAPPKARLAVISALLSRNSEFDRQLGLHLGAELLSYRPKSRIVGVEHQGLLPTITFWSPKLWSVLAEAWREGAELLLQHADPTDASWQGSISRTLISSASEFLFNSWTNELGIELLEGQLTFPQADIEALAKAVINRLKHPIGGLPASTTKRLMAILSTLDTGTFIQRFNRFVVFDTHEENYIVKADGNIEESNVPTERVMVLANEFISDPVLLSSYLDTVLTTPRSSRISLFATEMAVKTKDKNLHRHVVARCLTLDSKTSFIFLSGFLEGVRRVEESKWELLALKLLKGNSVAAWKIQSVLFSGFSRDVVARLLKVIRLPTTDPVLFRPIGWSTAETQLIKSEREALAEAILSNATDGAVNMAVEISSNWVGKLGNAALSQDIHWRVLTDRRLFSKSMDGMESHYWETLAKAFRKFYPSRDIELLKAVLNTKNNLHVANTHSGAFEVLVDICATHPHDAWLTISRVIEHKRMGWSIRHWLGERDRAGNTSEKSSKHATLIEIFDSDEIFAWIDRSPNERKELLIDALPRTLEGPAGALTAGFIERYATTDEITRALVFRFFDGSYMGPRSQYRSNQREEARSWLSSAKTDRVVEWIGQFISHLSSEIEAAKIQEERSF
jgi:hypothetical protein